MALNNLQGSAYTESIMESRAVEPIRGSSRPFRDNDYTEYERVVADLSKLTEKKSEEELGSLRPAAVDEDDGYRLVHGSLHNADQEKKQLYHTSPGFIIVAVLLLLFTVFFSSAFYSLMGMQAENSKLLRAELAHDKVLQEKIAHLENQLKGQEQLVRDLEAVLRYRTQETQDIKAIKRDLSAIRSQGKTKTAAAAEQGQGVTLPRLVGDSAIELNLTGPRTATDKSSSSWSSKVSAFGESVSNGLSSAGQAIADGAKTTGNAVVEGAKAAGDAVVTGAKTAGAAIAKGAVATSKAVVDGAKVAGQAIAEGASATGGALADGAKITEKAAVTGASSAFKYFARSDSSSNNGNHTSTSKPGSGSSTGNA